VEVASIVDKDQFYSFNQVIENKEQFRGLNLIQKLDDRLKKFIDMIEDTTCKRCFNMAEKPEVGWCQARNVWRMRNCNERIFIKMVLTELIQQLFGGH
jgi:hypothetical protein